MADTHKSRSVLDASSDAEKPAYAEGARPSDDGSAGPSRAARGWGAAVLRTAIRLGQAGQPGRAAEMLRGTNINDADQAIIEEEVLFNEEQAVDSHPENDAEKISMREQQVPRNQQMTSLKVAQTAPIEEAQVSHQTGMTDAFTLLQWGNHRPAPRLLEPAQA